jgi:hypothetical protein
MVVLTNWSWLLYIIAPSVMTVPPAAATVRASLCDLRQSVPGTGLIVNRTIGWPPKHPANVLVTKMVANRRPSDGKAETAPQEFFDLLFSIQVARAPLPQVIPRHLLFLLGLALTIEELGGPERTRNSDLRFRKQPLSFEL